MLIGSGVIYAIGVPWLAGRVRPATWAAAVAEGMTQFLALGRGQGARRRGLFPAAWWFVGRRPERPLTGSATIPASAATIVEVEGGSAAPEAWRLNREAMLLLGAGPRALLLQIAHPLVAAGVAEHSDFRADPWRAPRRHARGATCGSSTARPPRHAARSAASTTLHPRDPRS